MSQVATVHLTLGNHDGNLTNLSRQDAVSPIVDALGNPAVRLYKKSGVYQIQPGYNLCVFSCFDEEGWKDVRPVPNEVNIATFHGAVSGCTTETGWSIDEGMPISFFETYDFCFLGDIHKPQMLAYRDGKPWIAYPGTPVQQNYAEQTEHGYLLWNILSRKDWTVETRQLPNPKPFLTIDWAGDLKKTLETARAAPPGSRFRIRSQTQLTQDDVHRLSEGLKTSMTATEVTYKSDFVMDKQIIKTTDSVVNKSDIRSPDTIIKLLKEFHKDSNLSSEDVSTMGDQARKYLSAVLANDDSNRQSKWTLRQLKWDNLFSYGEGNHINFDKLSGVVGIFGPNRTGKSSIVGTIMYSLFNTTDRGPMKNINVCNVRKPYCYSRAVIDHNGSTYVVERQTTKNTNKKGVVTAATSLNLFKTREDGELDDLCGEQRNDTEKSVRHLVGSPEDFLITSLSAQGETNQFISQGATKRRAVLTRFLDLDIFDKMYELASKDVNGIKSQLKNFPDRNWEELHESNEKSLSDCEANMQELSDRIAEGQAGLTLLRQELAKHNVSPVTQDDLSAQKRKTDDIEIRLVDCTDKIESFSSEVAEHQKKLKSLNELIAKYDVISLKKRLDAQKKLESSILELRHSHERESTLLTQQKKSLKILDEVPCGDDYPTCKFIKDAHLNRSRMEAQTAKVQKALDALQEAQTALESIKDEDVVDKISRHEKATTLISKLDLEISRKETEIERHSAVCSELSKTLIESKQRLLDIQKALENHENLEVVSIRKKIDDLSRSIKDWDASKLAYASRQGKLLSDIEKLTNEKTSRDALLKDIRIHELIANAFSKKGIPLLITRSQLPLINSEIQKILQGIVDFTIQIENDDESDTLEMYIDYGDSRRVVELCSGMEKTVAALSLRVAMINVSSLPKPDFFIIDEGFGTLDSAGVEACGRLLTSLKRYFKTIFVITHVDGIKDVADHVIEINKVEKDSKVEMA
jgi:DNA repair exonuclease SbcCD ATPase subunit